MNFTDICGIDPGYSTQGLAHIQCTPGVPPQVRQLDATVALKVDWEKDNLYIEDRVHAQINHIWNYISKHCQRRSTLILVEKWIANPRAKNNVVSYWRGRYDGLLLDLLSKNFERVLTLDPIWVSQFSNPKGKFTKRAESPDAMQLMTYIEASCRHWMPSFKAQHWLNENNVHFLLANGGLKQTKSKKHQLHYADALIMAIIGYIAAVNPLLGQGRPPHQQDIIEKLREILRIAQENDTR